MSKEWKISQNVMQYYDLIRFIHEQGYDWRYELQFTTNTLRFRTGQKLIDYELLEQIYSQMRYRVSEVMYMNKTGIVLGFNR